MKERGIIFNAEMVRAILDGRKTQTRRPIRFKRPDDDCTWCYGKGFEWIECGNEHSGYDYRQPCRCCWPNNPYEVGMTLWVRETWADVNSPDGPAICYRADGNYQGWSDFSKSFGPDYGAGPSMDYEAYPGEYCMWWMDLLRGEEGHSWKPSIHMPRWASRIDLKVTGVRAERLRDINSHDVIAEGIAWEDSRYSDVTIISRYQHLWQSMYGDKHPWETTWVWVLDFKVKQ